VGTAQTFPDLIPLPADFGPEGIAVGNGSTFYAGSLATATLGQILVGDLRTGDVSILMPADGRPSLGMKYDARSNLLFVARGNSGLGAVVDAASGQLVEEYTLNTTPQRFINDVVVTREAAYFTDTQAPFLYRVALGPAGEPAADATRIPLPANFRTNGIVATRNGEHLFVVSASQLYLLDTASYTPILVDLGGETLPNADGLLLDGKTLYVVQNMRNRIAVVELSPDYLSGEIVRFITEPFTSNASTKVPTTIAEFGNALYAVTAGFAAPTPDFVVRLRK
jgi:sugar lactone lactonase YvrE